MSAQTASGGFRVTDLGFNTVGDQQNAGQRLFGRQGEKAFQSA